MPKGRKFANSTTVCEKSIVLTCGKVYRGNPQTVYKSVRMHRKICVCCDEWMKLNESIKLKFDGSKGLLSQSQKKINDVMDDKILEYNPDFS